MSIGIDIVKISRIEKAVKNEGFVKKILSDYELGLQMSPIHIAASFAAKEAFSKAIGTGIRGFSMVDISLMHDSLGKPYFKFGDKVKKILYNMGILSVEVSISHEKDYAVAVAMVNTDTNFLYYKKAVSKFQNITDEYIISDKLVSKHIKKREKNIHKGDCGRLLIIAGSIGLTGAAIMSSRAALKSGAGLISLVVPESLNSVFEIATPEVMTIPVSDKNGIITAKDTEKIIQKVKAADCVLIGPGLGQSDDVTKIVENVIKACDKALIIDADGINAIAKNIDILKEHSCNIIITPHIGEFARLINKECSEILGNSEEMAHKFTRDFGVTVVLKSHNTIVADGKSIYKNILGNPGMATGGSGDVLAGVIASFVAQKMSPEAAAICGVYIHSLSADMSALDVGEYGLTPSDITEKIPYSIKYSIEV